MDLIYTNANRVDVGVLSAYAFDLSFGNDENDFEMTVGANEPTIELGAFAYIENTEYGGIVDAKKTTTNTETITYIGRTWHGILNSKVIQPDSGADYLIVSGDANAVLHQLIERLELGGLFYVADESGEIPASGITISNYKFERYCLAYDGIRAMLAAHNAKIKISLENRNVRLYAMPVADYSKFPVDGDVATLTVEEHKNKINHLICLGNGELANRQIVHLYADAFGNISETPYYTGIDEYAAKYELSNAESLDELRSNGKKELRKLRNNDVSEMELVENELAYDIGDIVGTTDERTKISASAAIAQKIVKIKNGVVNTEYKTGGD